MCYLYATENLFIITALTHFYWELLLQIRWNMPSNGIYALIAATITCRIELHSFTCDDDYRYNKQQCNPKNALDDFDHLWVTMWGKKA